MRKNSSDKPDQEQEDRFGRRMAFGLSLWGAVLVAASVASIGFGFPSRTAGSTVHTAFYSAFTVAYLVVFFHCLVRLIYSRWPSWLLFTVGFGGMTLAGLAGVATGVNAAPTAIVQDYLDLVRLGIVPLATVVLLSAAYASRARSRGHRGVNFRVYVKLAFTGLLFVIASKLGAFFLLGRLIGATSVNGWLAVEACSAVSLAILIVRTRRLVPADRDEIVVPTAYWAVPVLVARVLSLASYALEIELWWQIAGLELAGIAALMLGLAIANEQAHRAGAEKMRELQAMENVSWSLVGAASLSELSTALAQTMSENFQATASAVYLPGEADDELVIAAVHGLDDPTVAAGKSCSLRPGHRRGFHSGHTARAYASGTIQATTDIYSDVEFLPWRFVAQSDGLAVSVPLPYRNRVIGVVNLFLPGVETVSGTQAELLQAIAAAVSPSIENARLRSVLSERAEAAA